MRNLPVRKLKRNLVFSVEAWEQFTVWNHTDKAIAKRIYALIAAVLQDPFVGIGKPEPLKHNLAGYWSRRINDEHRLVYRVTHEQIEIASLKSHYDT